MERENTHFPNTNPEFAVFQEPVPKDKEKEKTVVKKKAKLEKSDQSHHLTGRQFICCQVLICDNLTGMQSFAQCLKQRPWLVLSYLGDDLYLKDLLLLIGKSSP